MLQCVRGLSLATTNLTMLIFSKLMRSESAAGIFSLMILSQSYWLCVFFYPQVRIYGPPETMTRFWYPAFLFLKIIFFCSLFTLYFLLALNTFCPTLNGMTPVVTLRPDPSPKSTLSAHNLVSLGDNLGLCNNSTFATLPHTEYMRWVQMLQALCHLV